MADIAVGDIMRITTDPGANLNYFYEEDPRGRLVRIKSIDGLTERQPFVGVEALTGRFNSVRYPSIYVHYLERL